MFTQETPEAGKTEQHTHDAAGQCDQGAIAIWATTRRHPVEKSAGGSSTTISGSATAGNKDEADVNLKVNLPDSVTIDAH
jgi:hypothetical protein